ncbi:MAG TPA: P1 family peptidase [Dehalococcoidia bacterium]|nr:P1 family peptidase [Dehalococcoidia bacterium]
MPASVRRLDSITDVSGLKVGHWTDRRAATGCTVVLCERGAVPGVDVRGAAPGSRETDLMRPGALVDQVHAVLLTGGSAFGLDAATGVMRWCEERGIGYRFGGACVPIVGAAVLFDLGIGRGAVRPDAAAGYAACRAARSGRIPEGSVGAGTGATVAKLGGPGTSLKGGIGTASEDAGSGIVVAALVAVNAAGEVVDSTDGSIVAGSRSAGGGFAPAYDIIRRGAEPPPPGENTTIGVVATNARLTKEQANRLAAVAHDGLARAIRPVHTMSDGDTIFSLATGDVDLPPRGQRAIEALGALAVERAIVKAVRAAKGLAGVPSAAEWLADRPFRA